MDQEKRVRVAAFWFAITGSIAGFGLFAYTVYVISIAFGYWQEILRSHFSAIIGLPSAAILAFAIVVFLRQTDGPIEFKGLGFEFKGASGQVAMWVICFLAIAGAIKLCW